MNAVDVANVVLNALVSTYGAEGAQEALAELISEANDRVDVEHDRFVNGFSHAFAAAIVDIGEDENEEEEEEEEEEDW